MCDQRKGRRIAGLHIDTDNVGLLGVVVHLLPKAVLYAGFLDVGNGK